MDAPSFQRGTYQARRSHRGAHQHCASGPWAICTTRPPRHRQWGFNMVLPFYCTTNIMFPHQSKMNAPRVQLWFGNGPLAAQRQILLGWNGVFSIFAFRMRNNANANMPETQSVQHVIPFYTGPTTSKNPTTIMDQSIAFLCPCTCRRKKTAMRLHRTHKMHLWWFGVFEFCDLLLVIVLESSAKKNGICVNTLTIQCSITP